VGQSAPDFQLLNSNEEPVKLSDFQGNRVVLFFFPRAGTSGCTRQACGFRDNFPQIEAADAVVIGLSPDKPADLAKWKEEENLPYTLLSDPDHAVAELYGVWGEKKMYGRSFMGVIRSHFIVNEQGLIEDVQFKVSPKNSVDRAMKALAG
jgi:peroxiredoxin Q/BCP